MLQFKFQILFWPLICWDQVSDGWYLIFFLFQMYIEQKNYENQIRWSVVQFWFPSKFCWWTPYTAHTAAVTRFPIENFSGPTAICPYVADITWLTIKKRSSGLTLKKPYVKLNVHFTKIRVVLSVNEFKYGRPVL